MSTFGLNVLSMYCLLFVSYDCSVTASGDSPLPECEFNIQITKENLTITRDCVLELTKITTTGEDRNDANSKNLLRVDVLPEYFKLEYADFDGLPIYWAWFFELRTCPPCDYATTLEVFINPESDPLERCKHRFIFIKSEPKDCLSSRKPIQGSTTVSTNTVPIQEITTVLANTMQSQENTTVTAKTKTDECKLEANKDDFANNPGKVAAVAGVCSFVTGAAAASTTICLVLRFCLAVPIRIRHRQKREQETD